jgi:hypothetical protein
MTAEVDRTPDIDPVFIGRIAKLYVDIYKVRGFLDAREYLARTCKHDEVLIEYMIPFIIAQGEDT